MTFPGIQIGLNSAKAELIVLVSVPLISGNRLNWIVFGLRLQPKIEIALIAGLDIYKANDGTFDSNNATITITVKQTTFDINYGLVAYYPFNGNADDKSGNDNHVEIFGATPSQDIFNKENSAFYFDGEDDYISTIMNIPQKNLTISLWTTPKAMTTNGWLLVLETDTNNSIQSWISFDKASSKFTWHYDNRDGGGSECQVKQIGSIEFEKIYHIVAVRDESLIKLYVNNESNMTEIDAGNINHKNLYIGARHVIPDNYDHYYNGMIDDIRIYNRALSEKEIQMLFEKCTHSLAITPIEDITINEDESITLPIPITHCQLLPESLSITVTSSNTDLFSNYYVNESNNHFSLTLKPAANMHGKSTFSILVKNSKGITDTTAFIVTIDPVDDPPILALPIDDIIANEDDKNTIIDLTQTFKDIDNNLITKTILANTNESIVNAHITNNTLTISYKPDQHGQSDITIAATSNSKVVTGTFNVLIKPVNDIPIANNDTLKLEEDTTKNSILKSSDIDNDTLTYHLIKTVENGSLNITDTGEFTFIPSQNFSGIDSFTFTVNDGIEESLPATVTLFVTAVDDPPFIVQSISDIEVNEDSPQQVISLSHVFNDIDNDNKFIIKTIQSNSNPTAVKAEIIDDQIILDFVPDQYGISDISILAESNGLTINEDFTVTIKPVNDFPSISNISEQFTDEDQPISIRIDVHDIDTPFDDLILNAFSINQTIVTNSNIHVSTLESDFLIKITPTHNQNGSTFIKLSLNDGEATVNKTFILQVEEINDPPEISIIPNQEMDEDTTLNIPFTIKDVDTPMHQLNVTITSSTPDMIKDEQIILSGNDDINKNIFITPIQNAAGKLTIKIQVNDGYKTTQQKSELSHR